MAALFDVDVDDPQADLRELDFHGLYDGGLKLLPVLVDLLDVHGGDGGAELTEDDVLGHLADIRKIEAQQTNNIDF